MGNGVLILSGPSRLLCQGPELCSERRQILDDRVPDDIQVNAEVRVNENISHAGDVRPRDARGQRFTLLDQVANGLADDLEVPDHRVDGF